MLKTFLEKSLASLALKDPQAKIGPHPRVDLGRLKVLVEFFPIGKKLHYCPTLQKEIVLDTFVVAYCLNGDFVYVSEAIQHDAQGKPTTFQIGEAPELRPLAELKKVQLLVPDTSELEVTLDYQRRALIGRGQQFNKGNGITLISNIGGRGVATIDTKVARQTSLKDGPYANTKMVLLTPELHTLTVTDQRRKTRAKTSVPIVLSLPDGSLSEPCTIVDMAEGSMRIRPRDRDTSLPAIQRGEAVLLNFDLGEAAQHYTIKASVIRRSAESCVVQLEGLVKDGKVGSFSPLDLLELKAGLINYGH